MYKWKVKKIFLENRPKYFANNKGLNINQTIWEELQEQGAVMETRITVISFSRYILFGWLTTFGSQLDSVGCILSFALDIISGC